MRINKVSSQDSVSEYFRIINSFNAKRSEASLFKKASFATAFGRRVMDAVSGLTDVLRGGSKADILKQPWEKIYEYLKNDIALQIFAKDDISKAAIDRFFGSDEIYQESIVKKLLQSKESTGNAQFDDLLDDIRGKFQSEINNLPSVAKIEQDDDLLRAFQELEAKGDLSRVNDADIDSALSTVKNKALSEGQSDAQQGFQFGQGKGKADEAAGVSPKGESGQPIESRPSGQPELAEAPSLKPGEQGELFRDDELYRGPTYYRTLFEAGEASQQAAKNSPLQLDLFMHTKKLSDSLGVDVSGKVRSIIESVKDLDLKVSSLKASNDYSDISKAIKDISDKNIKITKDVSELTEAIAKTSDDLTDSQLAVSKLAADATQQITSTMAQASKTVEDLVATGKISPEQASRLKKFLASTKDYLIAMGMGKALGYLAGAGLIYYAVSSFWSSEGEGTEAEGEGSGPAARSGLGGRGGRGGAVSVDPDALADSLQEAAYGDRTVEIARRFYKKQLVFELPEEFDGMRFVFLNDLRGGLDLKSEIDRPSYESVLFEALNDPATGGQIYDRYLAAYRGDKQKALNKASEEILERGLYRRKPLIGKSRADRYIGGEKLRGGRGMSGMGRRNLPRKFRRASDRSDHLSALLKQAKKEDSFPKEYIKDFKADLRHDDKRIKDYFSELGAMYEEEVALTEHSLKELYELHDPEEVTLTAHPNSIRVSEALGDGGLAENGLEQKEKMEDIALRTPTGNFVNRYASLKDLFNKIKK
jgi:ABC-type transporter Mla subunit MlaD